MHTSFSLRSRALVSFCSTVSAVNYEFSTLSEASCVGETALQRWSFQRRVDCTLQATLPPVVLQAANSPVRLSTKRAFPKEQISLKELHGCVFVKTTDRPYKDAVSPVRFWVRSLPGNG